MDDDNAAAAKSKKEKKSKGINSGKRRFNGEEDDDDEVEVEVEEEGCDVEAWDTLSKSFRQVQSVLDQNRALIQQANDNHQSRVHDNLVKNVDLIRQINGNISKVLSIYSHLSLNFSTILQQLRAVMAAKRDDEKVERTGELN